MEKFRPVERYTTYAEKKKIDDYTDENGKMPFVINPFMPCNSAWDRPMLAYIAKGGEWVGILLHDYKNFDDGEYAIWGSHDALALIPYENKIEAQIKQGNRAFMHILSNSRAVEELETHYARYYSAACLDKVKDYVLDWEDDKNEYPKYFSVKKDTKWGGFYGDFIGKPAAEGYDEYFRPRLDHIHETRICRAGILPRVPFYMGAGVRFDRARTDGRRIPNAFGRQWRLFAILTQTKRIIR